MIILGGMAGPNININFGPPRRRRRRRAVGGAGGLLALIVLAVLGYSKLNKPAPPAPAARLPAASSALEGLRSRDFGKDLQEIPATVVDKGPLRHVPYLSYRDGAVEFNVYGDPDAPACIEIGLFGAADAARRAACRDALASMLADPEDRSALQAMDLAKSKQTRGRLTFEITPETAPDAYGGWWASVYDARALDGSRASEAELGSVVAPRPGFEAAGSRPGEKVYLRYLRKNGTYVPVYSKKAR